MAYTKTVWVDGSAPAISAANLNKIEQGVYDSVRQDGTTAMSAQLITIAGSATTPAIAPTGDSNNGIFFPAADTIALGTAGSERFRVTSAGNVGIGDFASNNPITQFSVSSTTGGVVSVTTKRASGTNASPLTMSYGFYGYLDVERARISATDKSGNTLASDLSFYVNDSSGTMQNRLNITGAGNVGIGTTAPLAKVTSAGISGTPSTTDKGLLQVVNTDTNQGLSIGGYSASPYGMWIQSIDSRSGANSTSPIILNPTGGNVGIGTTAPSAKLELSDGTITLQHDLVAGGGYVGTKSNHPLVLFTNNTEKVRITTAGNVGIGTTAPTDVLEVVGGIRRKMVSIGSNASPSSEVGIQYQYDNSTSRTGIYFHNTYNNNGRAWMSFWISDSSNVFKEKMRIDGFSENVLIGYTSSNGAYPLQVNGQIFATSSTIATSDQRYKENITPLTGALNLVNALNPVQFDWKQHAVHNFNTDQPTVGFLAQEVAEVLKDQPYLNSVIKKSECMWETETGEFVDVVTQVEVDGEFVDEIKQEAVKETHTEEFYGIAESNLIAILTKAIQELSAEVQALKAQISAK